MATNSSRFTASDTSRRATTSSPSSGRKICSTWRSSITTARSLLLRQKPDVDRLVGVPLRVELLRLGHDGVGELQAILGVVAEADRLGVVVEDEPERGTYAADTVVDLDLGIGLDVQLAGLLRVGLRGVPRRLGRAEEPADEIGLLVDGRVGRDDRARVDAEA